MLGDHLKELRKQKGMSQEELANRIHVVRQTISKWEKNLSVPDAEMLQRIADEFEVSVNELLGAESEKEPERNEIAQQLARINEQLVVKNRRTGKIIRIAVIVIAALFVLKIALAWIGAVQYGAGKSSMSTSMDISAEDPLYTEAEVDEAMTVFREYFGKNFKGCDLKNISYSEDTSVENASKYAQKYSEEFAIILESEFTTGRKVKTDGIEPNKTYAGWHWILTKSGSNDWIVQEYIEY